MSEGRRVHRKSDGLHLLAGVPGLKIPCLGVFLSLGLRGVSGFLLWFSSSPRPF